MNPILRSFPGGGNWWLLFALCAAGCATRAAEKWPSLVDLEGHRRPWAELRGRRATVLLFISIDCPISNKALPEIEELEAATKGRGVQFVAVYPIASEKSGEIRKHQQEYGLMATACRDPGMQLAEKLGAHVTPEAVIVASDGGVIYQGRVNDQYFALGEGRPGATRHDLREALEDYLAGRPPRNPRTPAVGCSFRVP